MAVCILAWGEIEAIKLAEWAHVSTCQKRHDYILNALMATHVNILSAAVWIVIYLWLAGFIYFYFTVLSNKGNLYREIHCPAVEMSHYNYLCKCVALPTEPQQTNTDVVVY